MVAAWCSGTVLLLFSWDDWESHEKLQIQIYSYSTTIKQNQQRMDWEEDQCFSPIRAQNHVETTWGLHTGHLRVIWFFYFCKGMDLPNQDADRNTKYCVLYSRKKCFKSVLFKGHARICNHATVCCSCFFCFFFPWPPCVCRWLSSFLFFHKVNSKHPEWHEWQIPGTTANLSG